MEKTYKVTRRYILEEVYNVQASSGKEAKAKTDSVNPASSTKVRELSGTTRRVKA